MINMRNYKHTLTLMNGEIIEFEKDSSLLINHKGFIRVNDTTKVNQDHIMIIQTEEILEDNENV